MKTILKLRWLILILWLAAAAGLMLGGPKLEQLVRDKGQIGVPDGYPSKQADELLAQMHADSAITAEGKSTVLVFHDPNGIGNSVNEMRGAVDKLKSKSSELGIKSVTTHLDTKELEKQMLSPDGKTALVLLQVDLQGRTPAEARDALYAALSDVKMEHYFTGAWLIDEDVIESSQAGLKKTEGLTVVFILVILILVFRSPVAPFIPLIVVGISFLIGQQAIAVLAETMNFPLSNFTQIFMVAVMFGIGTDYCILLISRFKEELGHSGDKFSAIASTYRTAGKTVFFSGLAVLVGFATIGLSKFALYKSAFGVAVGVAVMLAALLTLVPFFMAVLGKAMFWPARGKLAHAQSKLWGAAGSFSLRRPVASLAIIAAIAVPFLGFYKGNVSFNSLEEIGSKYNSVKAFNLVSDSFGAGASLPTTIVLKNDQRLDTPEGLAALEQIAREVAKVDGVKQVRTASRPVGEPLRDLQVAKQADTVGNGLGDGVNGINQIESGLAAASKEIGGSAPQLKEASSAADKLIGGTQALKAGVEQLGGGLRSIEKGLQDGSVGAEQLGQGLRQAHDSSLQLTAASRELLGHYEQLGVGLGQLRQGYKQIADQAKALASGLGDFGQSMTGLAERYPDLAKDPEFAKAQGALSQLQSGASQLEAGLRGMNEKLAAAEQGVTQANAGYKQALAGQEAVTQGLSGLSDGLGQLREGLVQGADGQRQIVTKLPELLKGFDQIAGGQAQLKDGYDKLGGQLGQLTDGLNRSVDGLSQLSDGLKSAQSYLVQLAAAPNRELTGWYAPKEALSNAEFQKVLNAYLSKDGKFATIEVEFAGNPYQTETLKKVDEVYAAVARAVKAPGSGLAHPVFAIGGVTSVYNDLSHISSEDYSRTVTLMLLGIGIILIFMFRSFVIPLYLIASLILTFYVSLAIAETIFVRWLGFSGITWTTPFFGFVLLTSLGVDYSIFLMDRFKEYKHLPAKEAILEAMKNMGTVIMSAAVILGGTFAAMLPSGILSLMQIATIVLTGLVMYALVVLPLFVPVMVRLFGNLNWWPFAAERDRDRAGQIEPSSGV